MWDDSESELKRYLKKKNTEKLQCFGLLSKTKTHSHTHLHTNTQHTTVWAEAVHRLWLCCGGSSVAAVVYLCLCRHARCIAHCFTRSTKLNSLERAVGCVWLIITNEIATEMLMLRLCDIRLLSQRNHESAASIGQLGERRSV